MNCNFCKTDFEPYPELKFFQGKIWCGSCNTTLFVKVKVGKKKHFEDIRPGQVFTDGKEKFLKITNGISTALNITTFEVSDKFTNYDDVWFLGESCFEV